MYSGVRSRTFQRETTAGREIIEREWVRLTSTFISKWSEVMEESLAAKVMTEQRDNIWKTPLIIFCVSAYTRF